MDARHLFDTLARQEQPPTGVDVDRAVSAGRAARRRRAGVAALSVGAAVTVLWLGLPQPGQREVTAAVVPPATATAGEPEPGAGFREMRKKYPPVGSVASMPEVPIWLWLGRPSAPGRNGVVLCHATDAGGAACSSFPPLGAGELARRQGALERRAGPIFYGVARTEVHAVTAVTADGRRFPGSVERKAGAGLGVWAVRLPPDVATAALVLADADGRTLQRVRLG